MPAGFPCSKKPVFMRLCGLLRNRKNYYCKKDATYEEQFRKGRRLLTLHDFFDFIQFKAADVGNFFQSFMFPQ